MAVYYIVGYYSSEKKERSITKAMSTVTSKVLIYRPRGEWMINKL